MVTRTSFIFKWYSAFSSWIDYLLKSFCDSRDKWTNHKVSFSLGRCQSSISELNECGWICWPSVVSIRSTYKLFVWLTANIWKLNSRANTRKQSVTVGFNMTRTIWADGKILQLKFKRLAIIANRTFYCKVQSKKLLSSCTTVMEKSELKSLDCLTTGAERESRLFSLLHSSILRDIFAPNLPWKEQGKYQFY